MEILLTSCSIDISIHNLIVKEFPWSAFFNFHVDRLMYFLQRFLHLFQDYFQ